MMRRGSIWISVGLLVLLASAAGAEIKLPSIIGSNMVVQQGRELPVWGTADANETVTVSFCGKSAEARADAKGAWKATLPATKAGGPFEMTLKGSSGATVTLTNVLVGEVWVCSGQSNMQFALRGSNNGEAEVAAAKYPNIRLITVPRKTAETPQADFDGKWTQCSPETAAGFSAVAYFFGREIHTRAKVPVGLINTSWGGTPSESWASRKSLEAQPSLKPLLERWDKSVAAFDPQKAKADYDKQMKAWQAAAEKAKAEKKRAPRQPRMPQSPAFNSHRPANLYNGMIAPLIPYAIRGAIWYQGESNVSRAKQYRTVFPTMIRNWRTDWKQGDFPFYFVQISPFRYGGNDPAMCAELREAQNLALETLPNMGVAVTMDVGNPRDIHPRNKQDVGKRLALWALAKLHGQKIVYSGPIYDRMSAEGDKIRVSFDYVANGFRSRDGKPLTHFTIAGPDKKFLPATVIVEGDSLLVYSDAVKDPVAVRFAWRDDAVPNLMNSEGLPASPFRTDDWPMLTENNH